jgi:hypothetical protein
MTKSITVAVDETTFNAARVIRLLGTGNRKGFSTRDQPHRTSRLCVVPDVVVTLSADALRAVADLAPNDKGSKPASSSAGPAASGSGQYQHRLKVEEWLRARNVTLHGTKSADGRTIYLIQCPFDAGHGQRAETSVMQDPAGKMAAKCMHDSCNGRGWQQFKEKIGAPEPGHYDPPLSPRSGDGDAGQSPVILPWQPPIPLSELPRAPAAPVDVFPPSLQAVVLEVAWALNCPPDFALVAIISMAGGAIGNARHLAITRTHHQWAAIYAAIIGPPGSVKSPVIKLLRKPFDRAQERYQQEWRAAVANWEQEEDAGPKPIMRRCVVGDTTTESLCLLLHENPRGLMMIKDELSGLVAGLNQYKGGQGHDRQIYLQLWAGDTIVVDRKSDRTGEPLYVADAFLAIFGGIQPAVLDSLRGQGNKGARAVADGWIDRYLFCYPAELPAVGEQWREVSEQALATWDTTVQRLLALPMYQEEDGCRPFYIKLTDRGRAAWEQFTAAHAEETNAEAFPEYLKGVWSKMRGYCGRLALVLCYLRRTCTPPEGWPVPIIPDEEVTVHDMEGAARLIAYFKGHARKVYALMDADPRCADARRVLRCLAANRDFGKAGFTRRDLYLHLRRYFNAPDALDAPLKMLVEHRYLRVETPERYGRPGPNPDRYHINPLWDRQPRTQDPHDPQDQAGEGEPVDLVDPVYAPGEGSHESERGAGDDVGRAQDPQDPRDAPASANDATDAMQEGEL